MLPPGYEVQFVCKVCTSSFEKVNDYVQHKKKIHFEEFQKNKTIVFEERTISNPSQSDDHNGQFNFDATIKQENLPRDEDEDEWITDPESIDPNFTNNDRDSRINPNPNENITPSPSELYILPECVNFNVQNPLSTETKNVNYSVAVGDTQDRSISLLEPKSEATFYDSEYEEDETYLNNPSQPSRRNPSVRLKRLTSNEIQNTSFSNIQSSSDSKHSSNLPNSSTLPAPAPATNVGAVPVQHSVSVRTNFNFECKLCRKKYNAETDLQLHEKVCASYSALFNTNAQSSKEQILNSPATKDKDPLLILQGNNTPTTDKAVKSTRKTLTTEEKYEILQKLETQKQTQIIKETGISSSVLSRIKHDKEKITENWLRGRKTCKKHRICSRPDVDKALFEWFTKERNEGHFVSRRELQCQGLTFALLFDQNDNWQCTSSWIERFRARHNIVWKSSLVKSAGTEVQNQNRDRDQNMEYQSGLIFNGPYD